jgi:copper chaperone CopZ
MTTTTYTVTGMTCGHCVAAVTKEIEALAGVVQVEVQLEAAIAVVTGTASTDAVLAAVVEAGYDARPQR